MTTNKQAASVRRVLPTISFAGLSFTVVFSPSALPTQIPVWGWGGTSPGPRSHQPVARALRGLSGSKHSKPAPTSSPHQKRDRSRPLAAPTPTVGVALRQVARTATRGQLDMVVDNYAHKHPAVQPGRPAIPGCTCTLSRSQAPRSTWLRHSSGSSPSGAALRQLPYRRRPHCRDRAVHRRLERPRHTLCLDQGPQHRHRHRPTASRDTSGIRYAALESPRALLPNALQNSWAIALRPEHPPRDLPRSGIGPGRPPTRPAWNG